MEFEFNYIIESVTQTISDALLEINFFNHETILVSIEAAQDILDYANIIPKQILDVIQSYDYCKTTAY